MVMALFNKLFTSRKRYQRHQDNVCEKLFHFNNDQVRVVLFRECDFRGRKLLFDSQAVEKIPLPKPAEQSDSTVLTEEERKKRFAEVSNGHGYLYTKPNSDVRQLGEMIFGSVAMSYRGTSYKIHSLTSPSSIMCTQVFPCPRPPTCVRGTRNSAPGRTCLHDGTSQSLEHSTRLEDSTNSFTTSFSDHSVHSAASDTLLVSRRTRSSPLDMPHTNGTNGSIPNTSLVRDSGFCGGQSYSSTFSGSKSISVWESSRNDGVSFSCGSLYKRWLRSTSTSLEHSLNSLTGSNSTDDFNAKPHPRTKKLGLAVIIQFGQNQEERLEEYLLEHAVLMEAMVWRLRHSAETAYIRHTNFLSLMFDITSATRLWLTSFLSGPQLSTHMWRTLSSNCDNCFSINDDTRDTFPRGLDSVTCSLDASTASADSSRSDNCERDDFAFLNISRFFKGDCDSRANDCVNGKHKRELARKFVRELCELLETVDIKHTNFFVSTLVTAILTHHLGWVATAWTPTEADKEVFRRLEKTGNPLWGQLNDLYGAVGHPTKMAHTVITGAENSELISKTLNAMTYFIRCNNIVRQTAARGDITSENDEAHTICHERNCIPEENYKKYEDHLKEFAVNSEKCEVERKFEDSKLTLSKVESSTLKCLRKSSSCLSGLNKIYDEVKNLDAKDHNLETDVKNKDDYNKLIDYENLKYARMPRNVVSCQNLQDFYNPNVLNKNPNLNNPNLKNSNLKNPNLNNPNLNTPNLKNSNLNYPNLETDKEKEFSLCDDFNKILTPDKLRTTLRKIPRSVVSCHNLQKLNTDEEFQMNQSQLRTSLNDIIEKESNVVFVLGDDDELVGLKKDNLKMQSVKRKTSITNVNPCNEEIQFNDEDFVKLDSVYNLKPSTSYNQLNREGACSSSRAASEPPEILKPTNETSTKPRFHYTGVKFNFKQHPQIFTNYMRSKNIEMTKFNGQLASDFDFSPYREETEVETLQTPSNASELEFVSEIQGGSNAEFRQATATVEEAPKFVRTVLPNTVIREFGRSHCSTATITEEGNLEQEENNNVGKIKTVELPMPKSIISNSVVTIGYTNSLFRGVSENYTSDMVLQGISTPKSVWEHTLRKDLILAARHPLLDQPIEEAVAIIANTDTWEVQLMSSHTYVIDKGTSGVRIGMSQLVANMLEQLLRMWKLHAPPEHCLMHIEDRLQEVCMRSKALAELLQATEFCTMDLLTSTLQLEVNDIPLLMAVASTHSPQITEKYGLSFQ